jgi:Domain of unknown function (DUF4288)
MRWFAAHIVMTVEFKQHEQDYFPAWENIVLIKAVSEAEAYQQAEALGRADQGDDGGTFRWGNRPAKWVFAGVRKITECALLGDAPGTGDEITYTEFQFKTSNDVKRFVEGKTSAVVVNDTYRAINPDEGQSQKKPAGKTDARRKPA